jgi:hypothetical protein
MTSTARAEFVSLLDGLEQIKASIAELVARQDGDHRHSVVQIRRSMSQQLTDIGAAGERLFADTTALATFRSKFSRLRATTAAHQADWPAVLLGERPDAFRASAEPMRVAGADFLHWAREAVRTLT